MRMRMPFTAAANRLKSGRSDIYSHAENRDDHAPCLEEFAQTFAGFDGGFRAPDEAENLVSEHAQKLRVGNYGIEQIGVDVGRLMLDAIAVVLVITHRARR